jgi:hypothetical protein
MNVFRITVPAVAVAAVMMSVVAPVHAKAVKTSVCKSTYYGAIGRGLSETKQKWSQKVSASIGGPWASIKRAADLDYVCDNNNRMNICKLRARPCRATTVLHSNQFQ